MNLSAIVLKRISQKFIFSLSHHPLLPTDLLSRGLCGEDWKRVGKSYSFQHYTEVVVMTTHHHQAYHTTFVIDHVVLLYCVLFSESCSAEQTYPESGAEHHHGTERSYLVIFTTCPITSRQHRAAAERCSSLHFTSVTVHLSLARVALFHLRVVQSFPSRIVFFFFFYFHAVKQLRKNYITNFNRHESALYIIILVTEDHLSGGYIFASHVISKRV